MIGQRPFRARRAWLVAGALAIVVHAIAWIADPAPYFMLGDSIGYLQTMLEPVPSLKAPLGYALVLFLPLLVWRSLETIILVQVAATLASGALAAWITRAGMRDAPPAPRARISAAIAAFLLVALWPRHVYYAHTVLSECLAIFWILATAALLLAGPERRSYHLATGAALAMAMLTRSASIALWPGVLAVILLLPRESTARPVEGTRSGWPTRLRRGAWVVAGAALLLVPYAGANRLLNGGFTLTAFDGWTLFGTVGEHVDVTRIQDPEVREVFAAHESALTALTPSSLRWSARSPAVQLDLRYRESYREPSLRESIRREGLLAALGDAWRGPPHPEILANRALRGIALRTIADHPGTYLRGALARFGTYWLGRDHYAGHFQSLAGTETHERNFRLPRLEGVLGDRYGRELPGDGPGRLLAARYAAYDVRGILLVPVIVAAGLAVRRRIWDGPIRTTTALMALALSLSLGTAMVAEIYDRYTVVTDALVLTSAVVATAWVLSRRPRRSA